MEIKATLVQHATYWAWQKHACQKWLLGGKQPTHFLERKQHKASDEDETNNIKTRAQR